ncbi:DUF1707 and DUF4190 domain-containing protein [Streptomyces chiangmaiensis]|uniref:DUF1707 and DUF4190 domain-containing protein n=1 Tax=Streptomyces chiangmaiensis TaxID=766497 RepID=A0ABU7FHA5_9ACTN|nr:DUF1707 and DUF4190 domain-containing protein [Streptomyces chiangmaiensis]MED7823511.1 DUF1707 and DUF4190 domain-containing protein [Streptomyces chiangmaiensis]
MSYPSWQPWQQGQGQGGFPQPWPGQAVPSVPPSLLASHADRERAVDVLRAGYAEGRLGQPEFDDRVTRAYAARTLGELALLVADLPQGPAARTDVVPQTFLPAPRPKTNEKAVGALICGLLCLPTAGLTGIPAVVLGHAARAEIRRRGEGGDGLALTGLVLGWLATAGWALVLVLLLTAALVTE